MSKPKYITIENYRKFKPSEFVRSFISDIETAEKIGKPMDMSNYFENFEGTCLPCLGGMACMNLGFVSVYATDIIGETVARLGDRIRVGKGKYINYQLKILYPKYKNCKLPNREMISGETTKRDLTRLKQRINTYADIIEASGQ